MTNEKYVWSFTMPYRTVIQVGVHLTDTSYFWNNLFDGIKPLKSELGVVRKKELKLEFSKIARRHFAISCGGRCSNLWKWAAKHEYTFNDSCWEFSCSTANTPHATHHITRHTQKSNSPVKFKLFRCIVKDNRHKYQRTHWHFDHAEA